MNPLRSLERFSARARRRTAAERCELCASTLATPHRHVVDLRERKLLCVCSPCSSVFPDSAASRYRSVPTQIRSDRAWTMSPADVELLSVPVGLAFFVRSSSLGRWTAIFPNPAGATEAELPDGAWEAFAEGCPLARTVQDDVEAFLVYRRRDGRASALATPVDRCYELAAILRQNWRGMDGGSEVRRAVEDYMTQMEAKAVGP
ncbi:MAG TPA: DUF5947 family protein [Polyangiaceae bacterium]|nr:DUF5947 family protein [Polyangiaceae bacterium]